MDVRVCVDDRYVGLYNQAHYQHVHCHKVLPDEGFMPVDSLQTGMTVSGPITTDADGAAVISVEDSSGDDDDDYSSFAWSQYAASLQTADGKLMIVDLRAATVGSGPGSSLHGEVFVDRTVVGVGMLLLQRLLWVPLPDCTSSSTIT